MCENRTPFLSLDEARSAGPGKAFDLGTVLGRHSLVAWVSDYRGPRASLDVTVALEVSHDCDHWRQFGLLALFDNGVESWPTSRSDKVWAWPARYVRANITAWQIGEALVSATIASA